MARRHRGTTDNEPVMVVAAGGTFETEVRGEAHYQAAITACVDGCVIEQSSDLACHAEFDARLVREPENRHDANAVAVTSIGAGTLGYLPRELAIELAPSLDQISGLPAVQCRGACVRAPGSAVGTMEFRDLAESARPGRSRRRCSRRSAAKRSRRCGKREDSSASVTTQAL